MGQTNEQIETEALAAQAQGQYVVASEKWKQLIDQTKDDPDYELDQEYYLEEMNQSLCLARVEMEKH